MRSAIADAGLHPDDIGYINAHGTGTPENDKMEWLGVSAVFGERAGALPISSNKSMIGHTLSAAGAIEAAFTVLTLQTLVLPPTINYETSGSRAAGGLRAERGAKGASGARALQFVRFWWAECEFGVRGTPLTPTLAPGTRGWRGDQCG